MGNNFYLLRTGIFTLTAFDAVRSLAFALGSNSVLALAPELGVAPLSVGYGEYLGDRNVLGTAVRTVMTSCAGYVGTVIKSLLRHAYNSLLCLVKRLEIFHVGNIVLHLLNV